jgi:hypothetical protein
MPADFRIDWHANGWSASQPTNHIGQTRTNNPVRQAGGAYLHAFAALNAQDAPHRSQHYHAVAAGADEGVLQGRQGIHHRIMAVQHL